MKTSTKRSRKKTAAKSDAQRSFPGDAPPGILRALEKHARRDLWIARLALGLYETISGVESDRLFPGYRWQQQDIHEFPLGLRGAAQELFVWGQQPEITLNQLLISRNRIIAAVHALRRASPRGKACIAIADRIRQEHPVQHNPVSGVGVGVRPTMTVDIMPDMRGRPLTGRTLRLIQNLNPASIQVYQHNGAVVWNQVPTAVTIHLNPDRYTIGAIVMFVAVPEPIPRVRRIAGELEDFFETGTGGVIWALQDDENFGYDGLSIIDAGDHLTITDQIGRKIWSGVIRCDRRIGQRSHPGNPEFKQPCALGQWVHWTQRGFKPDDWARPFVRPEYDRLRGILIKKAAIGAMAPAGRPEKEAHR